MKLTSVIIDNDGNLHLYHFPGDKVPLLSWIKDKAKKDSLGLSDYAWEKLYENGVTDDGCTSMQIVTDDILVTELTNEEMGTTLANHLNAWPMQDKLEAMCQSISRPSEQKLVADFCLAFMIYLAFLEPHLVDPRNGQAALLGNQILSLLMEDKITYKPTYELRQMIEARKAVAFQQT